MSLDHDALKSACTKIVRSTLWQSSDPRNVDDIISRDQIASTLAAYVEEAEEAAEYLAQLGADPNVVTRAVLFLAHEHAIPPMKDDIRWFRDALDILVRLVRPNCPPSEESVRFMADLEDGVRRYREEL